MNKLVGLALGFALVAAIAVVSTPANGSAQWTAADEIARLHNEISGLQNRVRELESEVTRLHNSRVIVAAPTPQAQPSVDERVPLEIKQQSEIVKVRPRGMFRPLEYRQSASVR